MPSESSWTPITTSWKSLSPVALGRSSKPISSSRPPGATAGEDLHGVRRIERRERVEDGGAGECAQGRALQHRREAAVGVGRRPRAGRDERQVVRQRAEPVEAVLDQEEGDALAIRRRAEVHGAGAGRHVQRVAEQYLDVADGAVRGDLVGAERIGIGRRGGLQLRREADRAVAGQERLVGDAVDQGRVDRRAFRQDRQEGLEAQHGVGIGARAARHHHEIAAGVIAFHLEARAAEGEQGAGRTTNAAVARSDGEGAPSCQHALDVHHIVGAEGHDRVAVEVGQGVAHCIRALPGVDPVDAGAAADEVGARAAIERVVARAASHRVVALAARDHVIAVAPGERVVASHTVEGFAGRAAE